MNFYNNTARSFIAWKNKFCPFSVLDLYYTYKDD